MAFGKDIAAKAPPPDKLKDYKAGGKGEDPIVADDEEEEGEDEKSAVAVSQMQEFMDAAGLKGDAEELCRLLEQYLDTVGYRK